MCHWSVDPLDGSVVTTNSPTTLVDTAQRVTAWSEPHVRTPPFHRPLATCSLLRDSELGPIPRVRGASGGSRVTASWPPWYSYISHCTPRRVSHRMQQHSFPKRQHSAMQPEGKKSSPQHKSSRCCCCCCSSAIFPHARPQLNTKILHAPSLFSPAREDGVRAQAPKER